MKRIFFVLTAMLVTVAAYAQLPKVYDETIDPIAQIDSAVVTAATENKHVICQVGGNWCPWCLRLADYIKNDADISGIIDDSYVYIHVNYPRNATPEALLRRLGNPGRFGYPVLVVLDPSGNVIHIQDTALLEDGKSYDKDKLMRFFTNWTPDATSHN